MVEQGLETRDFELDGERNVVTVAAFEVLLVEIPVVDQLIVPKSGLSKLLGVSLEFGVEEAL